MENTRYVAIALVSLFLTQTARAQETREAICAPVEVNVSRDGILLRCANDVLDGGGIVRTFAVSAADAEFADRFLNTAKAAVAGGRGLAVRYHAGSLLPRNPPAPGCGKECRLVDSISIR